MWREMPVEGDQWTLTQGDRLCGVITVHEVDQPWVSGRWTPTAEFALWAGLFERDLALVRADSWDEVGVADFEEVQAAIRQALQLRYPDGRTVPEFLLHVDGSTAWFRWNAEPDD